MNQLLEKIGKLSREELFEAAQFLSQEISSGRFPEEDETKALATISTLPFEHIDEYENMARILLMAAAMNPDLIANVENAIAGAGKKQLVLGRAEIALLGGLFLVGLQTVITKGASSRSEIIKYEEDERGKKTITINKKTTYAISSVLETIFKAYFK
jgi:hypothetical protein